MAATRARVAAGAAASQPEKGLTRGPLTPPRLVCPLNSPDSIIWPVYVKSHRVPDGLESALGHEPLHDRYVTRPNDSDTGPEPARGCPLQRGTLCHPWVTVETNV